MAVVDPLGALIAQLRADSGVAALAGTRVSTKVQAAWAMPTYAVVVSRAGGGAVEDAGMLTPRVDVWCCGPDERTAGVLWATVHAALCVPDRSRAESFTRANTRVCTVSLEGGPNNSFDPGGTGQWEGVLGTYRLTLLAVAA